MITEEQISSFISPVYWSLHLCNVAISEIKILSIPRESLAELSLVNNHTFSLYRSTLQYCFVMEYCKLLEADSKRRNHHVASLYGLNTKILHTKTRFKDVHELNHSHLSEITNSTLYNTIKRLRDSKFAHSDKHVINKPFEIAGLSLDTIEEIFRHLNIMKMVLNNCAYTIDTEYDLSIPDRDSRTDNFIRFQAQYKEFYFDSNQ